ncbi:MULTISPECIES: hypothetical protein [unclassified Mesorhizobium]|uniref:hypothetical protein n=1 Tax=unclassified Mesorhizobium TaxID=325217 RepID=UPI00333CC9B3
MKRLNTMLGNFSFSPSVVTPIAVVMMLIIAAAAGYRLEIDAIGLRFEPQDLPKSQDMPKLP